MGSLNAAVHVVQVSMTGCTACNFINLMTVSITYYITSTINCTNIFMGELRSMAGGTGGTGCHMTELAVADAQCMVECQ